AAATKAVNAIFFGKRFMALHAPGVFASLLRLQYRELSRSAHDWRSSTERRVTRWASRSHDPRRSPVWIAFALPTSVQALFLLPRKPRCRWDRTHRRLLQAERSDSEPAAPATRPWASSPRGNSSHLQDR